MSEVIIEGVKFKNVPDKRYGTKIGDLLTQSNVGMTQTVADYMHSDAFYTLINSVDIDWNGVEVEDGLVLNTTSDLINWIKSKGSGGGVEQIQSDWEQSDSTKKDFIKNKPNIPQVPEIDYKPTAGSNNLVTSGGVYAAINNITNVEKGSGVTTVHWDTYYWSDAFDLDNGDTITVTPKHITENQVVWSDNYREEHIIGSGFTYKATTDNEKVYVGFSGRDEYDYVIARKGDEPSDVSELKERVDGMEAQVNQLIADKAVISLTGNNNVFIVGSSSVTLTASTDTEATAIRIKKGNTVLNSGSGKSLQYVDTFTKTDAGSVAYTAEFVIAGITRSVSFTVYTVNYVYYGGGNSYTDVTNLSHVASARRNVAGTYSVAVAQSGQRVFFVIPSTMTISKATMGGFDFPLDAAQTVSVDGVSYKMYRSSNTIDAGTYQIVIS